ncbi:undecaprenyl-diphosphatase [Sphingomonas laterariae]|uniref:Undecaprenyl-diphosphatase n=1 Tax=Edaphosphingomonas laterariae TaxID=861865 RepID=A0A239FRG8_9SPHN|nr:phosphatase PAP2 family protein [Sphingomonas laterariae]SNS59646.1 undecaprenyl-diphosphatase [Sphingomonas laterariae]
MALAFTRLGDAGTRMILIPLLAGLLGWRRGWRTAALFVAIVMTGAALVALLKSAIGRPRPDLLPHLDSVTSASMPSGHAANNLIVWLAAARAWSPAPWPAVAALLLAAAIGVSRVMLAVHWPSDVVVGWLIGLSWVCGCFALARRSGCRR